MLQTVYTTPHILVVESDQEARTQYAHFLKQEGYDVVAVYDGTTAIKKLARYHFDLVITDYALCGMSGGKFMHTLRRWKKNVLTILTSTHPNISLIAAHYRAHGSFHKGDPLTQLAASISALLPNKASR